MQELKNILVQNDVIIDDEKTKKLFNFYNIVLTENKKYNLTSITEKHDFFVKHILDSLLAKKYFEGDLNMVDLGSGGGFPAVPLKIYNPNLNVVMIDSVGKKVNFLNFATKQLQLKNIVAVHERIEDFANKNREKFDVCSARAVAELSTLLEYALPLLKVGGICVFYKSQRLEEELSNAQNALKILGGKVEEICKYDLCGNERAVIVVKKQFATPQKYPRAQNKPRLMPL